MFLPDENYYEPTTRHAVAEGVNTIVEPEESNYLTRVERRIGRKVTLEEADKLIAAYRSPSPSTIRFLDGYIPF